VGSEEPVHVDVRVIAATNVDLAEAILQRRFRADLYHRLNVFEIWVPPLRERIGDIPLLAAHFLQKFGAARGVTGIEPDAMKALIAYPWPGNIRELENVIVSAVIKAKSGMVRVEHLKTKLAGKASAVPEDGDLREIGRKAGREMLRAGLVRRLEQNGGDMDEAALYFGRKKSWAYWLLKEPPSAA
jgi:transcriptional regulator with GAF, ATPase, and Fis domain